MNIFSTASVAAVGINNCFVKHLHFVLDARLLRVLQVGVCRGAARLQQQVKRRSGNGKLSGEAKTASDAANGAAIARDQSAAITSDERRQRAGEHRSQQRPIAHTPIS